MIFLDAFSIPINHNNFIDLTGDKDDSNDNDTSSESIDEPLKFGNIEGLDALKIYSYPELKRMGINYKERKKIYGNKKEGITDFFCSEKNIVDDNNSVNNIIKIMFKSRQSNGHTYMLDRSAETKSPIRVFRKVREKNKVRFEGLYINNLIKDGISEIEYHMIRYFRVMIDITEDEEPIINNTNNSNINPIINPTPTRKSSKKNKNDVNNNNNTNNNNNNIISKMRNNKSSSSSSNTINKNNIINNANNNNPSTKNIDKEKSKDIIITEEKDKDKEKDKNKNSPSNTTSSKNGKSITSFFSTTSKKILSKESTTSKNGKTSNISPPQSSSKPENNIALDLKAKSKEINKTLNFNVESESEKNNNKNGSLTIENNNKVPNKISGNLFDFEDDFFVSNNKKILNSPKPWTRPVKKKKKLPQKVIEKKRLSEFVDSEEPCKKSRFLIFEEDEKITCTFCHLSFDVFNYDKHLILHRSKLVSDDIFLSKIVHQSKTRSVIEKLDEK